jgi:hypothetical protein
MRKRLLSAALLFAAAGPLAAQNVVRDSAFEMVLAPGWKAVALPSPTDHLFTKDLPDGKEMSVFLHQEVSVANTAEILREGRAAFEKQMDAVFTNQFPNAKPAPPPAFPVPGELLIERAYDGDVDGVPVRRIYTYFLSTGSTALAICQAPRAGWAAAQTEFAAMLGSLKLKVAKISDSTMTENLRRALPVLSGTFPAQWRLSVKAVSLVRAPGGGGGALTAVISFSRQNVCGVHETTRQFFNALAAGKTEKEALAALPSSLPVLSFREYPPLVAQIIGLAFGQASNSDPPPENLRLEIESPDSRCGKVTMLYKDADRFFGKQSDAGGLASALHFE